MMADIQGTIKKIGNISGTVEQPSGINGSLDGAYNYDLSVNKPSINGVKLAGNTELADIVYNLTGALSAEGWSDAVPYTQTAAINGITANMSPIIDVLLSDDPETAKAELTAWSCISKASTGAGTITFVCNETKPVTAINFKVKVV